LRREPADPNVIFVFWVLGFLTGLLTFSGRIVSFDPEQIAGLAVGFGLTLLVSYYYYSEFDREFEEEVG